VCLRISDFHSRSNREGIYPCWLLDLVQKSRQTQIPPQDSWIQKSKFICVQQCTSTRAFLHVKIEITSRVFTFWIFNWRIESRNLFPTKKASKEALQHSAVVELQSQLESGGFPARRESRWDLYDNSIAGPTRNRIYWSGNVEFCSLRFQTSTTTHSDSCCCNGDIIRQHFDCLLCPTDVDDVFWHSWRSSKRGYTVAKLLFVVRRTLATANTAAFFLHK
jgi:hypothetical protein